jgi:hypothetical protein
MPSAPYSRPPPFALPVPPPPHPLKKNTTSLPPPKKSDNAKSPCTPSLKGGRL